MDYTYLILFIRRFSRSMREAVKPVLNVRISIINFNSLNYIHLLDLIYKCNGILLKYSIHFIAESDLQFCWGQTFKATHPFIYFIFDAENKCPIFTGSFKGNWRSSDSKKMYRKKRGVEKLSIPIILKWFILTSIIHILTIFTKINDNFVENQKSKNSVFIHTYD